MAPSWLLAEADTEEQCRKRKFNDMCDGNDTSTVTFSPNEGETGSLGLFEIPSGSKMHAA